MKHGQAATEEKEIERRKKISETMKKNPNAGGRRQGSGRGKQGWYKGYWCDSSWELAFVIYNLENNIKFERNNKKFYYMFENKNHYWLPDFIMDDGTYVEVKGYEDEKTKAKHSSFTESLKIIRLDDIDLYIKYVEIKYGKNFITLYEDDFNKKRNEVKEYEKLKQKINNEIRKKEIFEKRRIKEEVRKKEISEQQKQYKLEKVLFIEKRKKDLLDVDLLKYGWVGIIAKKWNVTHTQVKRWIRKNVFDLKYYERK